MLSCEHTGGSWQKVLKAACEAEEKRECVGPAGELKLAAGVSAAHLIGPINSSQKRRQISLSVCFAVPSSQQQSPRTENTAARRLQHNGPTTLALAAADGVLRRRRAGGVRAGAQVRPGRHARPGAVHPQLRGQGHAGGRDGHGGRREGRRHVGQHEREQTEHTGYWTLDAGHWLAGWLSGWLSGCLASPQR